MLGDRRATLLVFLVLCCILVSMPNIIVVKAAEDSWATMEPMPTARSSLGVAVVDGKIYGIGGFNGSFLGTNEMYDPATDTWVTKTPMPTPRCNFAIAVHQNKIFVIGGTIGPMVDTGVNEVYDTITDTWETKSGMSVTRKGSCANVVNDKIYLIGGVQTGIPPFRVTGETRVYHISNDSWTTNTPIPTPVSNYASAVSDNKVYIISGHLDSGTDCNLTQIYEPATDTWSYGTPLPVAIFGASAGATSGVLAPKRFHLLYWDIQYVYDPENSTWTSGTPMLTARYGAGVAVVNDEIYVIGGSDGETYRNENEKYTPAGYIPEFPSWIILPLFLVIMLFAIIIRTKIFADSSLK